jgi:Domain of unknown function (DUF5667)
VAENREFDEILNTCLDMLAGGAALTDCLAQYPELAEELRPLLKTALYTRLTMQDIKPDPAFKTAARYQIAARLDAAKPRRQFFAGLMPRWALTTVAAVLLVVVAGSGTVAAATGVMPDNFLYPVKLATEQVQLGLTGSAIKEVELNSEFTDRRIEELTYTVSINDNARASETLQKLDANLMLVASVPSDGSKGGIFGVETESLAPEPTPQMALPSTTPAPELATAEPPAADGADAESQTMSASVMGIDISPEAELAMKLESYQALQLEKLHALLETAPPSLRPSLENTILLLEESYGIAISNWSR